MTPLYPSLSAFRSWIDLLILPALALFVASDSLYSDTRLAVSAALSPNVLITPIRETMPVTTTPATVAINAIFKKLTPPAAAVAAAPVAASAAACAVSEAVAAVKVLTICYPPSTYKEIPATASPIFIFHPSVASVALLIHVTISVSVSYHPLIISPESIAYNSSRAAFSLPCAAATLSS